MGAWAPGLGRVEWPNAGPGGVWRKEGIPQYVLFMFLITSFKKKVSWRFGALRGETQWEDAGMGVNMPHPGAECWVWCPAAAPDVSLLLTQTLRGNR